MTEEQFWTIIAKVDQDALEQGDEEGAVEPVLSLLLRKKEDDLQDFEEVLSQKLYALDGRAFADAAGEAGESDDTFLYARCYVVARGRAFYEKVLADPQKMPNGEAQSCEALLYIHRYAWSELTGNDESDWEFEATVSFESHSNEALWRD
jgi:hypothetical protein